MKAEYRRAIEYLTLVPSEKGAAWGNPSTHPAGCLFRYCTPDGRAYAGERGVVFGDPVQVSRGRAASWSPDTAGTLREWARREGVPPLPWQPWRLSPAHLYILARIQVQMDETFRDGLWRRGHRYSLPYRWPDDEFEVEDIDGRFDDDD